MPASASHAAEESGRSERSQVRRSAWREASSMPAALPISPTAGPMADVATVGSPIQSLLTRVSAPLAKACARPMTVQPRDIAKRQSPTTRTEVTTRIAGSALSGAVVAMVITAAVIIGVGVAAVFPRLPLVHLVEGDAGDLAIAGELVDAVADQLTRGRRPADDKHDLVAEAGDDDGIDDRPDGRRIHDDDVVVLLEARHQRLHALRAQEIGRALRLVAGGKHPVAGLRMQA